MTSLPITEYRLPNGARHEHVMEVADNLGERLSKLDQAGLIFEFEVLTTNDVSFTVADHVEGVDAAIHIVFAGTDKPKDVVIMDLIVQSEGYLKRKEKENEE